MSCTACKVAVWLYSLCCSASRPDSFTIPPPLPVHLSVYVRGLVTHAHRISPLDDRFGGVVSLQGLLDLHSKTDNLFGKGPSRFPLRAQTTSLINSTQGLLRLASGATHGESCDSSKHHPW